SRHHEPAQRDGVERPVFLELLHFVMVRHTCTITHQNARRWVPRGYPAALPGKTILPPKALTSAAVERLKPGRERREIPDAKSSGLYLIIQPTGAKSWAMRFRKPNGDKAKLTLGPVDFSGRELNGEPVIGMPLTLSAARSLVADIHRQRKMGRDVIADQK